MTGFTKEDVQSIARTIKRAKDGVAFLTGAGCSLSAGIPLAATLVKEMNDRFGEEIDRLLPADQRQSYGACMGALTLDERKSILDPYLTSAKINWANIGLAALIKHKIVKRVLTFNFDNVLARACGLLGEYPAIYDFGVAPSSEPDFLVSPAIIHLHGQGYGSTILNSDAETSAHADRIQPVIKDTLVNWDLIVVGYSGEADKVFPILEACYARKKRIYWIGFQDDPAPHLRPFLDKFKETIIYIGGADADAFLVALAQTMECFPPDVFSDPAKHLLDVFADVNPFPLKMTEKTNDLLERSKKKLAKHGADLRLDELESAVLTGDVGAAAKEPSTRNSGDDHSNLRAWAHFSVGTEIVTSSDTPSEDKLREAAVEFEKALAIKPDFHEALNNLGIALYELAKLKSNETLFQQAFEKYEAALKIKPNKHEGFNNWGNALSNLAKLKSDETLFQQAFEKYAAALKIKPDKYEAHSNWGAALTDLAELKRDETLFQQAFEKYATALNIKPDDHQTLYNWGLALSNLAKLKSDKILFQQAFEKYSAALKIKPDKHEALNNWGHALSNLAKLKSDEGLFQQAFEKYSAALKIKPDDYDALNNWGDALMRLWHLKADPSLLEQAQDVLDRAEKLKPEKSYNRACLAALKSDEEGCRKRLNICRDAGTLPSKAHLVADDDLESMRDRTWFKDFIASLP